MTEDKITFDSIETDTLSVDAEYLHQIVEMMAAGERITTDKIRIETDTGTLTITSMSGFDTVIVEHENDG